MSGPSAQGKAPAVATVGASKDVLLTPLNYTKSEADHSRDFIAAIEFSGLTAPENVIADGALHRFSSNGKRGKLNGWYVLHGGDIPAGAFGCWASDINQTWRADIGRNLTKAENEAHRARMAAMKAAREQAESLQHEETAAECEKILSQCHDATTANAYLSAKQVQAYGVKELNGALVIPMRDAGGKLWNLQFIYPDGKKRFRTGGKKRGCYARIAGSKDADKRTICIAEGYATAATIRQATGYAVAVAGDAGNLEPVARAIRSNKPDARLIICADDDHMTEGNPGITKAKAAAQAVGGFVAVPKFGSDRPEKATDFNDLAAWESLDAVKACFDDVEYFKAEACEVQNAAPVEYAKDVNLVCANELKPEAIQWLWLGWLAAGKMHLFGGAPGTGKTTISMSLAAIVTTGGRWPDGSRAIAGNVVIWSGEDDPADTLIPRLVLSGADLSRVYFITEIREGSERRSFDPSRDMEPLKRKLTEIGGVKLLIVDPIVSAVTGDSHKNAEVRRSLQPLVDLAGAMRCALLGITHFSKGTGGRDPVERLTGSLAFGALARVVLVAAKHQEEGDDGRTVRLFCRAKSNIGPDDGGFEYDLHQGELKTHPGIFSSCVQWGDAVEGAARELLATADATGDDGEGGTLADAKRFLADLLSDGPLPVKAIKGDADGAGYSWATIRRAQKSLGIEAVKEGMKAGWVWKLPIRESDRDGFDNPKMLKNPEDAQQNKVSTFAKSEHLQGDSCAVEVEV